VLAIHLAAPGSARPRARASLATPEDAAGETAGETAEDAAGETADAPAAELTSPRTA
jgi:hypothetical protein